MTNSSVFSYSRKTILLLAMVALTTGSPLSQANTRISTEFSSFSVAEAQSVYQTMKDWKGKQHRGNYAATFDKFAVSAHWNAWTLSLFSRFDYRLKFSNDTARLFYEDKNKISPQQARQYKVDLDVVHHVSKGAGFAYTFQPHTSLTLTPQLSLFESGDLLDGRLKGIASYSDDGESSAELALDYYYEEDKIFDRPLDDAPQGRGYALDLGLTWNIDEQWTLALQTSDLYARIDWKEAPFTTARSRAAPLATDDPFEYYKQATISGVESFDRFRQHLPMRLESRISYALPQAELALETWGEPQQTYFAPSISRSIGAWTLTGLAEVRTQALGVRLKHSNFGLELISNSLDYQKSDLLRFNIGAAIPL